MKLLLRYQVQFSRVWLCDPVDCSMPGFHIHYQLPELAQTLIIICLFSLAHIHTALSQNFRNWAVQVRMKHFSHLATFIMFRPSPPIQFQKDNLFPWKAVWERERERLRERERVCVCVCACTRACLVCPILCNPMDCSPPGSSVQGTHIPCISCISRQILYDLRHLRNLVSLAFFK